MQTGNKTLLANTAATLTLDAPAHAILLSNAGAAVVYGKVNWVTGVSEVAAADFHFLIKAGDVLRLELPGEIAGLIDTLRLISTANAVVGYVAA